MIGLKMRGPIRVVEVCNVSSSANAMLKHRVLGIRARGLDARILCNPGPYVESLRQSGIPVETVDLPRGFNVFKVATSLLTMVDYFRREKIDLVHTHFSVGGFIGRVAARMAGVPVVVHTIHGLPFHAKSSWLQKTFYIHLERSVGALADQVLSQNRGNLEDALRYRLVPSERLRHIGNGIQLDRFRPVPRPASSDAPFTIICVARLEKVKNHPMLFDAVARLRQQGRRVRVWLVGEGELLEKHTKRCERLGIADIVEFLGYREDVPSLLQQSDVAVLTSLKEGIPRAMMEAMAMGVPAVGTRIPGTVDAIRHDETGFTVEPDDCRSLALRLAQLMDDAELRARMGARAREVAIEEFDEEAITESLGQVYRNLLHRKGIVGAIAFPQVVRS